MISNKFDSNTDSIIASNTNTWNHLTVCIQMTYNSFKNKVT